MKRIEDIENMEVDALEEQAKAGNAPVPEGFRERLESALAAKAIADESSPEPKPKPRKGKPVFKPSARKLLGWLPYAGIAAAIIVVVLAIGNKDRELIDTFDDPALAYAQVEDAFRQISDKMSHGMELASGTESTGDTPTNNNE